MTQKIKQDGVLGANPILDGGISKSIIENSNLHTIPVGAIIAIDSSVSGVVLPPSGSVFNNYMLCDGGAIPKGQKINGNTPDLTDDIFFRGSVSFGVGNINENNRILDINQMPIHTHNGGTTPITGEAGAANLNAGNQTRNHSHPAINESHYHDAWFDSDMSTGLTDGNLNYDFFVSQGYTNTAAAQVVGAEGAQTMNMGDNRFSHSHGINNRANHEHNTSGAISTNAGASASVDIRPKYFSVQYVIKVS